MSKRLVVGMSGASGAILGVRLLQVLRSTDVEVHLVITKPAELTLVQETDFDVGYVRSLADVNYNINDIGAAISSGSFRTLGMIVIPCSIRSMSELACGVTSNLLTRAADVTLKERRRLVIVLRETPLHTGHLRSLLSLAEAGAIIAPSVPAFYTRPKSVDDIVDHTVGRVLDLFDVDTGIVRRWGQAIEGTSARRRGNREKL